MYESHDEEEESDDSFKERLCDRINCMATLATFASGVSFAIESCPEVLVDGIGKINMPLSEAQAQQLIHKSHQAPYGKGSDTIVDTSVRNTWEIDPAQFELKGARWQSTLKYLLVQMAERLGINAPVSAELYKMLLYEKGAMFKAHTDTEKIPGMFGTLVIGLPSTHEGGDVVVKHCNQKKTLRTSVQVASCLFWYSDVSHEVLPVTSGYRWVLTYNLAVDPARQEPSTAIMDSDEKELRDLLTLWSQKIKDGSRGPTPLYFKLDHKYTEANISLQTLKTYDRHRVENLQRICSELHFDLFLTTLEKSENGSVEAPYNSYGYDRWYGRWGDDDEDEDEDDDHGGHHDLDDVLDTTFTLKSVFDLSGRKIASDIPFDEEDVLQNLVFGEEPDEEEYEGYMGNSGPEATHWYRESALVIVRAEGTPSFLCQGISNYGYGANVAVTEVPRFYLNKTRKFPGRKYLVKHMFSALKHIASRRSLSDLSGQCVDQILRLGISHNEANLLDLIFNKTPQPVATEFFPWVRDEFVKSPKSRQLLSKEFLRAFGTLKSTQNAYEALSAITGVTDEDGELEVLITQAVDYMLKTFESKTHVLEQDGSGVFDLLLYYKDFSFMKATLLRFAHTRCDSTAFLLDILRSLHQSIRRKQVPEGDAKSLYGDIARIAVRNLQAKSLGLVEDQSIRRGNYQAVDTSIRFVTHEQMLSFISSLFGFRLDDQLGTFADKLCQDSRSIPAGMFDVLWIPFLQDLVSVLEKHKVSLSTLRWRKVYQSVLQAFLTTFVRPEPKEPPITRQQVRCRCRDCSGLNHFLTSPEIVGRFSMGKRRRQHLHNQLEEAGIDCTHNTEHRGNPQTLIVTKTTAKYDKDKQAWEMRRLQSAYRLDAFDKPKLKLLLGDAYDAIINIDTQQSYNRASRGNISASPALQPARNRQNIPNPPAAVSKDPAQQLVDLDAEIARAASSTTSTTASNRPSAPTHTPLPPLSTASRPALAPSRSSDAFSISVFKRGEGSSTRLTPRTSSTWRGYTPSRPQGEASSRAAALSLLAQGRAPHPSYTMPNPVAGSKRKFVEVVDLTGED